MRWGASRYVAYVLRDRGEPGWVDLGSVADIDQMVAQLRTALADPGRREVKQLARALDEQVMQPVRPLVGESRVLILSPDGALNLIPFGALVDEAGRHLIDRYTFAYVTSGRDLLRFGTPGPRRSGPLVIADPDFDDAGTPAVAQDGGASPAGSSRRSVDFSSMHFLPLPGTASEGIALGKVLSGATFLTGAAATEAALKKARAPIILHVATHGFFLADQPETPATTQRDIGVVADAFAPASAQWIENPLLRSGLALAGANPLRSGDEDGVLTALEASGLDLWGTKLVVLSACETGIGTVQTGEGIYGLRRSLVVAGAESQVMSLWKVADEPTRDLMVSFYRKLLAGQGRAEALRQAQLEMLGSADRSHPFFWAAFIAGGDWRPIDGLMQGGRSLPADR
jgi:CHAT domain-containing protein